MKTNWGEVETLGVKKKNCQEEAGRRPEDKQNGQELGIFPLKKGGKEGSKDQEGPRGTGNVT